MKPKLLDLPQKEVVELLTFCFYQNAGFPFPEDVWYICIVTNIYIYIISKNELNVGNYASFMDPSWVLNDLKKPYLESRWCPIFKAIVAGF